jgi:hypothetical protein
MIHDRAIAHVLHPLTDPLPPALQQRGQQVLAALEGLDAKDQLNLTCRTVVAVLQAARPRFAASAQDHAAYNTLCDAVRQWIRREMGPLRFRRPQ